MVEGVAFPHPSLVNRFLRRGLSNETRLNLGAQHEAGHVQTLPFAVLFAFALLLAVTRRPPRPWWKLGAALLGANAFWELLSETYVVANVGEEYRRAYPHPTTNLAAFWVGMVTLVGVTQWLVLRQPRARTNRGRG